MSLHAATPDDDDERPEGEPARSDQAGNPAPGWLVDLRRSDHRRGFYQSLGNYALVFTDRGSDQLIVSFDNLSSARDEAIGREPWGYGFVANNGWSQLGVMAFTPRWFRDPALFAVLEDMAASGFFRRFRSVTLTGTSMGGYAACAFARLVPGCTVVAFSPQSTLRKDLVPWETRFAAGRKADWSGPYADAAADCAAAGRVFLIHDPLFEPDRQHAARFCHANTVPLPVRHSGHKSALFLRRAGLLSTIMREAVEGGLTAARFHALCREGRKLPWYRRGVIERAYARGRPELAARVIRYMRQRGQAYAAHILRKRHLAMTGMDPFLTRARTP
ncbi:hypothetical protein [Paracoccus sp. (in: a-proteobacteria)]|uniref:hypothetical protein n=1 Tax=Paracoccus sp. TaxID=267 RepID=UPI00322061C5